MSLIDTKKGEYAPLFHYDSRAANKRDIGRTVSGKDDFSITLSRTGCLGNCPDYKITISANGTIRYEGHAYVTVEGIRATRISSSAVQKLIRTLQDQDFFH